MVILIIVVAILLGYAGWYLISLRYVRIGEEFIAMTGSYLSIIDQSGVLSTKDLSSLPQLEAIDGYFKAEFYPGNPKAFFDQMEYAYQCTSGLYERIENHEINFRTDDWFKIRMYHETLEDIHNKMRVKRWQNFGL